MPVSGGTTSVLAGQTVKGFADGNGTEALFYGGGGLVVHPITGIVYITDSTRIRICTATGLVSTLTSLTTSFHLSCSIVFNPTLVYLYVTSGNILSQFVVSNGSTTTLAGSGASTSINGQGRRASFNYPMYVN